MKAHRRAGLTLTEVLLSLVVLFLSLGIFAKLVSNSAASISSSHLSTYAADAADATAQAINNGNPLYTKTRTLNGSDLQLLTSAGGRRQRISAALNGTITARPSDPPSYLITIRGPGVEFQAVATAPGGTP